MGYRSPDLRHGGYGIDKKTRIVMGSGPRNGTIPVEVEIACVPPTDPAILKVIDDDLTNVIVRNWQVVWSKHDLTKWFRSAEEKDGDIISTWLKNQCEGICKSRGKRTPRLKYLENKTDGTYTIGRAERMKVESVW